MEGKHPPRRKRFTTGLQEVLERCWGDSDLWGRTNDSMRMVIGLSDKFFRPGPSRFFYCRRQDAAPVNPYFRGYLRSVISWYFLANVNCRVSSKETLTSGSYATFTTPTPSLVSAGRTTGCKPIRAWFTKFQGAPTHRLLIVDAAFRAFVRDNSADPLDVDLNSEDCVFSHRVPHGTRPEDGPSSSKRLRSISPYLSEPCTF